MQELELEEIEDIMQRKEDTEKFTDTRFKIESLDTANRTFRKLKAIEDKINETKELADREIERILEWRDKEVENVGQAKDFFNFLLTEYYTEQRELDPKFKLSTPYGKVSSRKQQAEWKYDDEKVVEWLKANELESLRVKYEPIKTEIKKTYMVSDIFVTTEDKVLQKVTQR